MTVDGSQPTTGFFDRVDHVNDAPKTGHGKSAADAGVRCAQNHRVSGRAHAVDSPDQDTEARGVHERDAGEVDDDVRIEGRSLSHPLAQRRRGEGVDFTFGMNENET
jgi:hypothetical protein